MQDTDMNLAKIALMLNLTDLEIQNKGKARNEGQGEKSTQREGKDRET